MKLSVNRLLAIVALSVSMQVTAAQPVKKEDINSSQVKLDIPITRSSFYVMIEMPGGKVYTERIGMQ